jgi:exopolyphosphatase/guanosine-5'-triphosphate,3'-diphosphate pyrophosphatase
LRSGTAEFIIGKIAAQDSLPGRKPMASSKIVSGGRVVAFLDLGTNSVRLLLVRINPNHSYATLTQQKEVVRLGEGEFVDQVLQPAAMDRAALVCRKFAELSRSYGAEEIMAITTSAVREAKNQIDFLRRLRQEANLDVRIISGKEEARLIYLGVSSGVHLEGKEAAFIDIGGGSTEVIAGDQRHYHFLSSLNLGAIRLTSIFFLPGESGPVTSERYALLQQHVRMSSVRTLQQMRQYRFDLVLGSSGTAENLSDIAARVLHNRHRQRDDVLPYRDLRKVIEMLCALPLEERRKVPGINPERADIIIAGAAILHTLMQDLGFSKLRVIGDRGLREGLLIDYLSRSEHAQLIRGLSVRQRSVLQLGRACGFDEVHGKHVAQLALELFDSADGIGLHHLGAHERELLQYAAQLHDIGTFLSYNNHHVHTYYLIRNAEMLGFDQSEIGLMATITFFHRKALPTKKHREMKGLDKRSRKSVQLLSLILRLAEVLDRGHTRAVKHVNLRAMRKNGLVLEIHAGGDCQLELWGVQSQLKAAQKILDREIQIKVLSKKKPARTLKSPQPLASPSPR